jgi:CRISPR-associated protein Cas1
MKRDYFIFTNGRLHRKENTIRFVPFEDDPQFDEELLLGIENDFGEENPKQKKVLPVQDVSAIYIMSEATINTRFIEFSNQNKIPLHFFNNFGYYTGSFYPKEYLISGFLLVNQTLHYVDYDKRLYLAQQFVIGASKNILKNIKYYNNRNNDFSVEIEKIEKMIDEVPDQNEIVDIMNIEGRIRKIYYSLYNHIITADLKFTKREFNPPKNEMNALISFANSLVYTSVLSELYRTQIDPTISFLHEPGTRRFSLALDLAEIFKPLLADRIIFKLLNKKSITNKDFEQELNGCYLKENGRKKLVAEFDSKLKTTIKHRELGRNVSYRRLIRLECYKLIKHLVEDKEYEPFVIWW